jgi:flavin reductase (DIM6/NTAB) family NADH-FMN oxidoreductase RutF
MEFSPETLPWNQLYKLMIGAVLPRPIGWISTLDTQGRPNLAPFSFFNAICPNPPHVLFCPMVRGSDGATKDSLRNVRETGEFVVNIVTESLAEAMNATSGEYPQDVNEFEIAGLTPVPSVVVRPFRVGESPVHFECRTAQIVDLGDEPGGGSVVIGRVVHVHVREDVLLDGDKINLEALQPIGRLAGNYYCRVTNLFEMTRPVVKVVEP